MLDVDEAEAPEADSFELAESRFEAMQQEAYWRLCQDQDEPLRALHHVTIIVLLEQLAELREVTRAGALTAAAAGAAMRSDVGLGYLFGLAAAYADACALPRTDRRVLAVQRELHAVVFGWRDGLDILARQTGRGAFDATEDFASGMAAALHDMQAYRHWLNGEEPEITTGLRDEVLRQARAAGARGLRLH